MPANALTLYLASWQKRMLKDFMPASYFTKVPLKDISRILITRAVVKCPQSYKIPAQGIRRGDWVMHLTDEQMLILKEQFGIRTPISSINIDPGLLDSGAVQFR